MKQLHFTSGIIISVFVGVHLYNHGMSIYGVDKHIEIMNYLRPVYRNVFAEAILLAAVFIQILSGIKLFKAKKNAFATNFEKIHNWSGIYLAMFFIFHLAAVFTGRFYLDLDTNFYFGAAGLNAFPFNLFFIPYYGLAILSFFGHIASIHSKKMKKNILCFTPDIQTYIILVSGVLATIGIFYGLTNHFNGITIPQEYKVLIGK